MHVSLAAEEIFRIGPIPVTNSIFSAVLLFSALILLSYWIKKRLSYEHPARWQLVLEALVSILYNLIRDILGKENGRKLFPFLFNFFLLILISNWFGLLPFVPSISIEKEHGQELELIAPVAAATIDETEQPEEEAKEISLSSCIETKDCYLTTEGLVRFEESAHLFRAPSSDLSFTVALAIISIAVTNYLGFKHLKLAYLKRYIDTSSPIKFVVGIIELFSEVSKVISFSFRLFGNIFAGEMLLLVITGITLGIATLPFLALEVFVGVIQAFVFLMLTAVFISVALSTEH